jgi:hypothetical protein
MTMRLALVLAFLATPAFASAKDDFVVCVVGQAAVALKHGDLKEDAFEIAYDMCPLPSGMTEADSELIAYINLMVERMAAE